MSDGETGKTMPSTQDLHEMLAPELRDALHQLIVTTEATPPTPADIAEARRVLDRVAAAHADQATVALAMYLQATSSATAHGSAVFDDWHPALLQQAIANRELVRANGGAMFCPAANKLTPDQIQGLVATALLPRMVVTFTRFGVEVGEASSQPPPTADQEPSKGQA